MSRVKNRLNELRGQGFATHGQMNYGGGGAGIMIRLPRIGGKLKATAAGAGVAGATLGSVPKPAASAREKGFASRDYALPVPTGPARPVSATKTATAPKVAALPTTATIATAQPISAPKPKKSKSRRTRTRRVRPGRDSDDENEEQKDTASYTKDAPSTIYSRVADVLRGK